MSLLDTLDPSFKELAYALVEVAKRAGVNPRVTSARRTLAKQQALYRAWQAGRSRYPAAPPGSSAHEYGLAFDMVVNGSQNQLDCGTVWERNFGQVYGGEEDPVHFEAASFRKGVQIDHPTAPSSSTLRKRLAEATDLFLSFLPTPVRGIVNIASLSNAIYQTASGRESLVLYWISHPQEFFNAMYDLWWSIMKSYF